MRPVLAALLLAVAGNLAHAQQTANPHGKLSIACAECHAADSWKPARIAKSYQHAPKTFPLEGAHARTSCTGCHRTLDFKGAKPSCASCHDDVHRGELGAECSRCHTPRSFAEEPSMRQAHERTRFPLRGAHATATCASCHPPSRSGRLQFVATTTSCAGCHAADARSATPDHQTAGFTRECTACHSTATWKNARFDHAQTAFPLAGAHQAVSCAGCHADKVYDGKSAQCVSCHRTEYDGAKDPRHADGFPTTCADCHGNTSWDGARFDHASTRFALTGAHNAAPCTSCHGDGVYRGKSTECLSCHQTDFQATTAPPHGSALFTAPCTSCHSTNAWGGAAFNHDGTKFILTGAHRATTCASCHADRVYAGKPTTCTSCHRQDYDAARTPPHSGFPTTCESCHATTTWTGARFDHAQTDFPLTGSHVAASCTSCHADGVFNGKPGDCVSCHRSRYDATTSPSHAAAGYSTTCATCHTTSQWAGAGFNHAATQFPLDGAHLAVSCITCHADNVYKGKPTDCLSCHQVDYSGTQQPPHASNGIGTTCKSCHTTTAWAGGTFNHGTTRFPLTGAHTAATCLSCHADGVYRGKGMTCVTCHQADYTQTTNPNHASASFPTTCESCHATTTWLGATFNHDGQFFPIYSGAHRGKWSSCATCHTSPTNYKSFTCLTCHEHRQSEMDAKHQGRAGYRYDSQACYACHPRGTH